MSKVLREVEFREGLRGYNRDEVDDFLERMALEADAIQNRLDGALDTISDLEEKIQELEANKGAPEIRYIEKEAERAPQVVQAGPTINVVDEHSLSEAMSKTLIHAQRTADAVLNEAREQANLLVVQAEAQAKQLETQSKEAIEKHVIALEANKAALQNEVIKLTKLLEVEREEMASGLSQLAEWVRSHLATDRLQSLVDGANVDSPSFDSTGPDSEPTPKVYNLDYFGETSADETELADIDLPSEPGSVDPGDFGTSVVGEDLNSTNGEFKISPSASIRIIEPGQSLFPE